MLDWCCIAAVNDDAVLRENLAHSESLRRDPGRLAVLRDQPSASLAYNAGMARTRARYCVFAHQDVYLPAGWDEALAQQIAALDAADPSWAVLGLFGVDPGGRHVGRVWSSGLRREVGQGFAGPVPAQSIDELLLVLDRRSGVRFDDRLPHFHLYGTDIVQSALVAGHSAYVVHAPVVHNSLPVATLKGGFSQAYRYMHRKWRDRLPIIAPVTRISWHGQDLRIRQIRRWRADLRGSGGLASAQTHVRPDPTGIARKLGYE